MEGKTLRILLDSLISNERDVNPLVFYIAKEDSQHKSLVIASPYEAGAVGIVMPYREGIDVTLTSVLKRVSIPTREENPEVSQESEVSDDPSL